MIHPRPIQTERAHAFTLVELVMVVTIIGILAAIAVPRMAEASGNASAKALEATLTNVRKTIDSYYAEHGRFPGYDPGTLAPSGTDFVDQLLKYSDRAGNTSATYGSPFLYGPYLRSPFPQNPTNLLSDVYVKSVPSDPTPAGGSVGWVAVLSTGAFGMSATNGGLDDIGIKDTDVKSRLLETR